MAYAKALSVIVVAFLAFSLPPYFTGHTRVPSTFVLHYPLLVGHVMFASVAMVMAVVQIWPGLRARRPALHRRCGRIYVAAAIPAAVCALVIGAATPFGPFLAVSNVMLAGIWLWFTTTGYLAAPPIPGASPSDDPQRHARAVDHLQPDLDTDHLHLLAAVAGHRL
jgi:uncharacterized membrane protein